jgi:chaperonin GroEL (HSP60 family)
MFVLLLLVCSVSAAQVCGDSGKGFVLINQKGVDPLCLDMLAKEGILALRRCGGAGAN